MATWTVEVRLIKTTGLPPEVKTKRLEQLAAGGGVPEAREGARRELPGHPPVGPRGGGLTVAQVTFGMLGSVIFDMTMAGGPVPPEVHPPNWLALSVSITCTEGAGAGDGALAARPRAGVARVSDCGRGHPPDAGRSMIAAMTGAGHSGRPGTQ